MSTIKYPKPLGQRVIIHPAEDLKQVGRIFIPEAAREKNTEGVVVQLGTGNTNDDGSHQAFEVKVGDKVLYSKFGGTELEIGKVKLKLVHEDDIIAILE